jgi:hypothetical protein
LLLVAKLLVVAAVVVAVAAVVVVAAAVVVVVVAVAVDVLPTKLAVKLESPLLDSTVLLDSIKQITKNEKMILKGVKLNVHEVALKKVKINKFERQIRKSKQELIL